MKATPECKKRLRTITKLIYENMPKEKREQKFNESDLSKINKIKEKEMKNFDPVGVLCLLAQHGNVCNVEKEIGVRMAYSLITNRVHVCF